MRLGDAVQRAQVDQEAKASMVGMTKEQAFACMGPQPRKLLKGRRRFGLIRQGMDVVQQPQSRGQIAILMQLVPATMFQVAAVLSGRPLASAPRDLVPPIVSQGGVVSQVGLNRR